jgi:hypothetical protein
MQRERASHSSVPQCLYTIYYVAALHSLEQRANGGIYCMRKRLPQLLQKWPRSHDVVRPQRNRRCCQPDTWRDELVLCGEPARQPILTAQGQGFRRGCAACWPEAVLPGAYWPEGAPEMASAARFQKAADHPCNSRTQQTG